MELQSSERQMPAFRKSESGSAVGESAVEQAHIDAAELFDAAMTGAGLRNPEVAHLCGVSESLVQKWRQRDTRACPSFVQMLCLPPAFHIALFRAQNTRQGLGRAALARLMDAAGDLAVVLEA